MGRVACAALLLLTTAAAAAEAPVRPPSVAGTFYPSDPAELSRTLRDHLASVPAQLRTANVPRLLIAPHAGLEYSGRAAAYAYKKIEGFSYDTVVLIGVCHRVPIPGASVWTDGAWRTPLGDVPVDTALARAIAAEHGSLKYPTRVFDGEHSLETQLVFLQSVLKDFRIVPILISDPSERFTGALADALAKHLKGRSALVVASTDLSHYRSLETARRMDARSVELIRKGDDRGLLKAARRDEVELCGIAPVLTALRLARRMDWSKPMPLIQTTSADRTNDTSSVVGYAAAVAYEKSATPRLTSAQRGRLLAIARDTVDRIVRLGERPPVPEPDAALAEVRGAFVTLRGPDGSLRGCMGHVVGSAPLAETVSLMSAAAATQDPRFSRVRPEELAGMRVEVSVLSPLSRVGDEEEIELGRHGVVLKNGARMGVFLPEVASETGWDKDRFLNELCTQKAGLGERCWDDADSELYVFTSEMIK